MTFGEHIKEQVRLAKAQGVQVTPDWVYQRIDLELPKWRKRAAAAEAPEEAETIYQAYPLKVGKADALKAITAALKVHSYAYLLERTELFAGCVSRWPASYRYGTTGRDTVPHPSTWFNRGSFEDDPQTWTRIGGRDLPPISKATVFQEPEPRGWKEWCRENTEFDLTGKTWATLEPIHRQYITSQLK